MITLLIKGSISITVLLAFYKLVLEKESFFKVNRIYLLACLGLACILPFISLPQLVENQGYVNRLINQSIPEKRREVLHIQEPIRIQERKIQTSKVENQASDNPAVKVDSDVSVAVDSAVDPRNTPRLGNNGKSFGFWLMLFYVFGVGILLFNLLAQIVHTLWKVYKNEDKIVDEDCIIVNVQGEAEPCSFFWYIFINPELYEYEAYEQIIAHERIHVQKWHSIDLIISELAVVFFWFNPFMWIFRNEIEKNIEYQTDDILTHQEADQKESYQMNLLKIATYTKPLQITTNYNQSLIKQRILKMNTKKSNPYSYWKYTFLAPITLMLLLSLNQPNTALTQNLNNSIVETTRNITKNYTTDSSSDSNDQEALQLDEENQTENAQNQEACLNLFKAILQGDSDQVTKLLQIVDANCNCGDREIQIVHEDVTVVVQNSLSPLSLAIERQQSSIAKLLLEANANPNFIYPGEGGPLTQAIVYDQEELIDLLLSKGANLNSFVPGGGTALMAAVEKKDCKLAHHLISEGAEVNLEVPWMGSPIIIATEKEDLPMIKLLVENGANVNSNVPGIGTPLSIAAGDSDIEICKYLMSQGAHINEYTIGVGTPLTVATANGNFDAIKYLVSEGGDLNNYAKGFGTALAIADKKGLDEIRDFLISHGATVQIDEEDDLEDRFENDNPDGSYYTDGDCEPLINAIQREDVSLVGKLVESIYPNCMHYSGDSEVELDGPSKIYIRNPRTPLVAAARVGNVKIGQLLLEHDAQVGVYVEGDETPLIAASANGHLDFVKLLVANGASINTRITRQGKGRYVLFTSTKGHTPTYQEFRDRGYPLSRLELGDGTALYAARINGHQEVADYLISKGAKTSTKALFDQGEGLADDCRSLLRAVKANQIERVEQLLKRVDPNCTYRGDGEPRSALVAAARKGYLEIGRLILLSNGEPEYHARGDESPLMAAARHKHFDFVQLLVQKGANVNQVVPGDGTALISAVRGGDLKVVEFLLKKGADPYQTSPGDEYAMYHARVSGNQKMIDLLKQYEK